jgi:tetratricopeptide (TPR) repeat protein
VTKGIYISKIALGLTLSLLAYGCFMPPRSEEFTRSFSIPNNELTERTFLGTPANAQTDILYLDGAPQSTQDLVENSPSSGRYYSSNRTFSAEETRLYLRHYIAAQKALSSNDLFTSEYHIKAGLELLVTPELLELLGSLYYLQGDSTTALKFWNKANELDPKPWN